MAIQIGKAKTPGTRACVRPTFKEITKTTPEKSLIQNHHRRKGRSTAGRITLRHRGGGHKRAYRKVDFKRNKREIQGKVFSIEYDPHRNARLALIHYEDGEKAYILCPDHLKVGAKVEAGENAPLDPGNSLPLAKIPLGSFVHNIELLPQKGGQIVRAAGCGARVLAKEANYVTLRLPSKEIRLVHQACYASLGSLGNREAANLALGKAGRKRWLGIRPTVRGSVMNPCDHPHGGGEGRAPIGRTYPYTPWGKVALGIKTRVQNKRSDLFILRRRP